MGKQAGIRTQVHGAAIMAQQERGDDLPSFTMAYTNPKQPFLDTVVQVAIMDDAAMSSPMKVRQMMRDVADELVKAVEVKRELAAKPT